LDHDEIIPGIQHEIRTQSHRNLREWAAGFTTIMT
jgi:hypothetical protein